MSQGRTYQLSQVLDAGPISPLQIAAMVLCSLVAFLDGIDSQSIAVGAPLIVAELGATRAAVGPILTSALLGAMIGAMTFGPLGDRFGRKRMLVAATVVFGIFTLATAYATSLPGLMAIRFCAGVGLGGATPCFLALASEYAPKRRRAMVASLIWAAFPLGATAGGFINSYILSVSGWRTMFIVGGVAPMAVALALMVWLPESIRFLLAANRDAARVGRILARIAPTIPAGARVVAGEERIPGAPLGQLFSHGRAVTTLLLWVPFFTAFGSIAIIAYWTPALLRAGGISAADTAIVLGVQSIGSIFGMASAGRLIERFGATPVLTIALLLGSLATAAIGFVATSVLSVSLIELVACFFVGMGASGSIAYAALVYPTALRSSGIGWAMGMGRGGQVALSLLTTMLVGYGWGTTEVFLAIAVAPFMGALGVLAMRLLLTRASALPELAV